MSLAKWDRAFGRTLWFVLGVCLLLSCSFHGQQAVADIEVTLRGPAGSRSQTIPGGSGAFDVNMPLAKNAVNNITVTATDEHGNSASKDVSITQVSFDSLVVASVTATPLSPERIEELVNSGVIDLDDPENYNVSEFAIVLTLGDRKIPVSVPIAIPKEGEQNIGYETYQVPQGDGSSGGKPPPSPIEIVVFEEALASEPGEPSPPKIAGVLIIEGRIKTLKEFFSVRFLLMNTSGIFTLTDVFAALDFPDTGLANILPADGVASLGEILPGAAGVPGQKEKEFIIRGDEIGERGVVVNFGGLVTGPGIPEDKAIPFNGSVRTSVEVKGPPTFQVRVSHPDKVERNVPYELLVDITNTGYSPALYTSLDLDVGASAKLVECELNASGDPVCSEVDPPATRAFGHIFPGETVRGSFTVMPKESGIISSCLGIADQNINLQVLVGAGGCLVGNYPADRGGSNGPAVSVLPTPNMLGVGLVSPVTAFFSRKMKLSSITTGPGGSFNVYNSAGERVGGKLSFDTINDKTVVVWQVQHGLRTAFFPNTEYSVELGTGITDENGVSLASSWKSTFTTTGEDLDDTTPPTISLAVQPPVNPNAVIPGQLVRIDAYTADQGSWITRAELRLKDLDVADSQFQLVDQKRLNDGEDSLFSFVVNSRTLIFGHTYQVMGTAYDAMGNSQNATIGLVILADAAAPTVSLPDDTGAEIRQGLRLSLTPEQVTGGVWEVRYFLDGASTPFETVGLTPYSTGLSTLALTLGSHTITARVVDGLGKTGSDTYTFEVVENANPPVVAFSSPTQGSAHVQGSRFIVRTVVEDEIGISKVDYFLDAVGSTPLASTMQPFILDTSGLDLGAHRLIVRATNSLGVPNDVNDPASYVDFQIVDELPGPPPAAPVISQAILTSPGTVTVSGTSVAGARVDISNTTLGITVSVFANGSGAFSGTLNGDAGNQISVIAYDSSQTAASEAATATVVAAASLESIDVLPLSITFTAKGQYRDIAVTGHYSDGSSKNITAQAVFSSSASAVASVSANGRVGAVARGDALITVVAGGVVKQIPVFCDIVTLTHLSLSPADIDFTSVGETAQLVVTGHYDDGSSEVYSSGTLFTSGNPAVASVNAEGVVKAQSAGVTSVTASRTGVAPASASVKVTYDDVAPTVSILGPADGSNVERGDTVTINVRGQDELPGGVRKLSVQVSGETTWSEAAQISPPSGNVTRGFNFIVSESAAIGGGITVKAQAEDTNGKLSPLASITLNVVDETAPAVSITTPANETSVNYGDTVNVKVEASDDVGVTEIRYETSGALAFSARRGFAPQPGTRTADFSFVVPFGVSDPDVEIHAYAKDARGNEKAAIPVSILITQADITPPETRATATSDPSGSAVTTVSYEVVSGLEDLDHVELFFRRNGIGTFNRYTDIAGGNAEGKFHPQSGATGTIVFDSTRMGGDGDYEFYTIGIDAVGNREVAPDDGAGGVLADQSRSISAGQPVTLINANRAIVDGDASYDNQNLRVDGVTLTLSGSHSFKNVELINGAVLTHPETDLSAEYGIDVSAWTLTLDSTSSVNVNGRGYLGGNRGGNGCTGQTLSGLTGSTESSGGSYGGRGATNEGTPGEPYGSLVNPGELGSGGACRQGWAGGDGGGRVTVRAVNIVNDGSISANGANGSGNDAGSGSGGSVNFAVSTLSGKGRVRANGGSFQVGGGGGRIAVSFIDISTLDRGLLEALGGDVSGSRDGGNGTVFLKGIDETNGTLVIDGQGAATSFTSLPIPSGYVFDNIVIRNNARVIADDPLVVNDTLSLETGSIITHSRGHEAGVKIQASSVIVDATSSIDVSSKGYRGGLRDGNSSCSGETLGGAAFGSVETSGGSYGGLGGHHSGGGPNPVYGHPADPVYLGSGGACRQGWAGGNGGGRVEIEASQSLVVEGAILANGQGGDGNDAGSGSGGSVRIETSLLKGTGSITANGGAHQVGGGGGRVAVYYDYLGKPGDDLGDLRNIQAFGGKVNPDGSAGSVYLKRSDQTAGDLYIDADSSATASNYTPLATVGFGTVKSVDNSDPTRTVITTDGLVRMIPNGLVGVEFSPDLSQDETFIILENTGTTITIAKTALAAAGNAYSAVYRFDNVKFRRGGYLVLGERLFIGNTLRIAEKGKITHYDARIDGFTSRIEIVAGKVEIESESSINVDGRGYLGGNREGNGCSGQTAPDVTGLVGSSEPSGGSFGGLGAYRGGTPNMVYGSLTDPAENGSGGSCRLGWAGGDGGGEVHIVAGELQVDGVISAGGAGGSGNDAGSGSGGTINITAGVLSGTGTVRANGGTYQVGGGGGRIAVRFDSMSFDESGFEVLGANPGYNGGHGTLFLKQSGQSFGDLIIDGHGVSVPIDNSIIPGGYTFDNVILRNSGKAVADKGLKIQDSLELLNGSVLSHTLRNEDGLNIEAASVLVDSTSAIDASARGYRGGLSDGNPICSGETLGGVAGAAETSGGSYGGLGYVRNGAGTNVIYGDLKDPAELGSGGSCGQGWKGGNGGGKVTIAASGAVQIDGSIRVNGQNGDGNDAGSGSGGSVNIRSSLLSGSGLIQANGGAYQTGGGGGRVSVEYDNLAFSTSHFEVKGGNASADGGNGTLFLKSSAQTFGDLIIDGFGSATPANQSPIPSGYTFDNITLRNNATVTADSLLSVNGTLTLAANSRLYHTQGLESGLQIRTENLVIDETSAIDVNGRGYAGGLTSGNGLCSGLTLGGVPGSAESSGGSYGGLGAHYSGAGPNPAYGHPRDPIYLGSGGACRQGWSGGNGGGHVDVEASGFVVVNGFISADGSGGSGNNAGSGSGGSVKIVTSEIRGKGSIHANGGAYQVGGGGGRIAIFYDTLGGIGEDLGELRNIVARGGHVSPDGSAGTVLLRQTGQLYGDLYIDEELTSGTSTNWTPLTHVGFGTILDVAGDGSTTTITTDGTVSMIPGGLVGVEFNPDLSQDETFEILANDERTITIGATPLAAIGDSYAGVYRFDNVFFRRGGFLVSGDKLIVGGTMKIAESAMLTHYDARLDFESRLDLTVGLLEIENGSRINVNGRGYLGGMRNGNGCTGQTISGLTGSRESSGGSYGGLGGSYGGTPNTLYGSESDPVHLGSGGACRQGWEGGDGGGAVLITADDIENNGIISADGSGGGGNNAGSGSGGSVNIHTKSFSGTGSISAKGGANQVGGGGGRVAVYRSRGDFPRANVSVAGGKVSPDGQDGTVHMD